ncbi:MAG: DUF3999 family protein [Saprospiraceae bacterium]|nr:DUF3999 family protein [Lewinella sp.]
MINQFGREGILKKKDRDTWGPEGFSAKWIWCNWLLLFLLLGFGNTELTAQWDHYQFERPLSGVDQQWHRIALPNELFRHLRLNYADLRIMGISPEGDTIEAPYLLQIPEDRVAVEKTAFRLLNPGTKGKEYFVTLEQLSPQITNRIQLNFANKNFDWHLKLEGSQDQKEWFTLLDNYRILNIENEASDYTFSTIHFRESKYPYYRIVLPATEGIKLLSATSSHNVRKQEAYQEYRIINQQQTENKEDRRSELEIDLAWPIPVSAIRLEVDADFDYYRPISIQTLTDSTITETDTIYHFEEIHQDVLSSLEDPIFYFPAVRTHSLKVVIHNHDNTPLTISKLQVLGWPPSLIARFTEPADYVLRYGWPDARPPRYDLANFADKIPEKMSTLELGTEVQLLVPGLEKEPLLSNKWWLWGILIVAVAVLGWFAMRMLRA